MSKSTPSVEQIVPQNLQLAPIRSLDDFILGSARFQLPQFNDFEKWGNRVVKNLLYYQTNYFILFFGIYLLMTMVNPAKIICGVIVKVMILGIVSYFFTSEAGKNAVQNPMHKWYFLGGSVAIGYMLLAWYDALLLSAFTLLLPFGLTFIHASLRLRNIKNKVVNSMESLGPQTPMSVFLHAMNLTGEGILS